MERCDDFGMAEKVAEREAWYQEAHDDGCDVYERYLNDPLVATCPQNPGFDCGEEDDLPF